MTAIPEVKNAKVTSITFSDGVALLGKFDVTYTCKEGYELMLRIMLKCQFSVTMIIGNVEMISFSFRILLQRVDPTLDSCWDSQSAFLITNVLRVFD